MQRGGLRGGKVYAVRNGERPEILLYTEKTSRVETRVEHIPRPNGRRNLYRNDGRRQGRAKGIKTERKEGRKKGRSTERGLSKGDFLYPPNIPFAIAPPFPSFCVSHFPCHLHVSVLPYRLSFFLYPQTFFIAYVRFSFLLSFLFAPSSSPYGGQLRLNLFTGFPLPPPPSQID